MMTSPALAAVALDSSESGGGIAVVTELLWAVLQHAFGSRARLIALLPGGHPTPSFIDKVRFGTKLVQAQVAGRTDWILFSHLALAKAQTGLPSRLRVPYGVFLHGIEAWCPLSTREQQILRDADVRLSNSAYTAGRVMSAHPDIGEVIACPLALPPAATQDACALSFDPGPHAVLVVGRMSAGEQYKGHDQLLEAWGFVLAQIPDARLIVAGGGDDLPRLRAKAATLGIDHTVIFTGFVSAAILNELYRRSALFALPSRGEGFGLVYLEAMRAGLPCVGSIHDAAGEVIRDGDTGCLVDQADIPGIATTLSRLLADAPLRARMGAAGRTRVNDMFSFDRFERQLLGVLNAPQGVAP
ncbi:MAG: glycosyltransferase family 4 protein [Acidobacteriaceae bacterium]|jgi:phosphatidylinositol alpha-1,6-mannosyltransferase|nr:glycosyltransferase family 4 protein [Acidobacteriaceae bacterium]